MTSDYVISENERRRSGDAVILAHNNDKDIVFSPPSSFILNPDGFNNSDSIIIESDNENRSDSKNKTTPPHPNFTFSKQSSNSRQLLSQSISCYSPHSMSSSPPSTNNPFHHHNNDTVIILSDDECCSGSSICDDKGGLLSGVLDTALTEIGNDINNEISVSVTNSDMIVDGDEMLFVGDGQRRQFNCLPPQDHEGYPKMVMQCNLVSTTTSSDSVGSGLSSSCFGEPYHTSPQFITSPNNVEPEYNTFGGNNYSVLKNFDSKVDADDVFGKMNRSTCNKQQFTPYNVSKKSQSPGKQRKGVVNRRKSPDTTTIASHPQLKFTPPSYEVTELSEANRLQANQRERRRTVEFNSTFDKLKASVPRLATDKTTKIQTLRLAHKYVTFLQELVGELED